MKKISAFILSFFCILSVYQFPARGVSAQGTLTWDGKPASLSEIAQYTNLDFADQDGRYQPIYYNHAYYLWKDGLFLGANGSFRLNKELTRTESVVMTLRLLGEEALALQADIPCPFTDVPAWAAPYVGYAHAKGIVNGYSETLFGAQEATTANQFITLCLRALGYKDPEDFLWEAAADKALSLNMFNKNCHAQYMRSNLFLRDQAAYIAYNALHFADMKQGGILYKTITLPSAPTGDAPIALAPEEPVAFTVTVLQESDYVSYATGDTPGIYIGGVLMKGANIYRVILEVNSGIGTIELKEYIGGAWRTRKMDVVEGQRYDITPQGSGTYTLVIAGNTYEGLKMGTHHVKA